MRKAIAIALIVCLVPACSYALDLSLFNFYAGVCGEENIIEESSGSGVFAAGDCSISFTEENNAITRVIIVGNGTSFLGYSMAAIMLFDSRQDHFVENAGVLLSAFIHSKTDGLQKGFILSGEFFVLNYSDDSFFFTIGK